MKQWFIVLLSLLLASFAVKSQAQLGTTEWSNRAGSISNDRVLDVATDAAGNSYATGFFAGAGVNFGGITTPQNARGAEEFFLVRYNSAGAAQSVATAGSSNATVARGQSVAVDNFGNIYVVGVFRGTLNFPTVSLTSVGTEDDAFVAKYGPAGNFITAARIGAGGRDQAFGVATDAIGNVYVTGQFQGTVTFGTTSVSSASPEFDIFISKWDGNFNLTWVSRIGGTGEDQARDIRVAGNDVYLAGIFSGNTAFDGINVSSAGRFDGFLAQYNGTTGRPNWVRTVGGAEDDYVNGIAIDATGIYTTGRFRRAANFSNTGTNSVSRTSAADSEDLFVAKYTTAGGLDLVTTAGGSGNEEGTAITTDGNGTIYVAGTYTRSFNYVNDAVRTAFNLTNLDDQDILIARYGSDLNAVSVLGYSNLGASEITGLSFSSGRLYLGGYYNGTTDFGSSFVQNNAGQSDLFVNRLNLGVTTLPTPVITQGTPSNCQVLLTATNVSGAVSFQWFRDGQPIIGANGSTFNASQGGNYTVTVTFANGSSTSVPVFVFISNTLSVNVQSATVGVGGSATLTANVTGLVGTPRFEWTVTGSSVIIGSNQSITVNPTIATDYTVTVIDQSNGCRASTIVRVNVQTSCPTRDDAVISIVPGNDNIVATSNIAEICQGQNTALQSVRFIGTTGNTYQWVRQPNIIAGQEGPVLSSIVIDGVYTLRITAPGCPQVESANSITVTTFPIPNVPGITSNQRPNDCSATEVVLTGSASGGTPFTAPFPAGVEGGYSYRWEPANAVIGSNTTRVVRVNPAVASTFTLTINDRIQCGRTNSITVSQIAPDVRIDPVGPINLCAGQSVTLNAFLNPGPVTGGFYTWRLNNTVLTGQTGASITVTSPGTYVATYTVPGCNAKFSNSVVVTLTANAIANAGVDRSYCVGNPGVSLGTTSIAGSVYSWSPAFGLNNANIANPVATPNVTTNYTLTVSVPGCGVVTDEVLVTVGRDFDAPIITTNLGSTSPIQLCTGESVQITLTNPDALANYQWFRDGILITGQDNQATITANIGGRYTARATSAAACTRNKTSNEIVLQFIGTPTANAGRDVTICQGQSVTLGTGGGVGLIYNWAPSVGLNNATVQNPVARPDFTTSYTLVVSTANGRCVSNPSVVTVTVVPVANRPSIVAEGPTSFCEGESVTLRIENFDPTAVYSWSNGAGNVERITVSLSGVYSVTIRNQAGGTNCNSTSNGISVSALPRELIRIPRIKPFGSQTLAICNNNSFVAWTDSLGRDYQYRWWRNGEVITDYSSDHRYRIAEPGIYHVEVRLGAFGSFCSTRKSEGLFVTSTPVAPPTVMADDREVCPQSEVCLVATGNTNHPNRQLTFWLTYANTNMNGAIDSLTATQDDRLMPNQRKYCVKPVDGQTTTYTVYVRDAYGCVAMDDATVVTKNVQRPTISVNTPGSPNVRQVVRNIRVNRGNQPSLTVGIDEINGVCDSAILTATPGVRGINDSFGYSYLRWYYINSTSTDVFNNAQQQFNNTNNLQGTTNRNVITANATGYYGVEGSIDGCPILTDTVFISFNPRFTLNVTGGGTFCENQNVSLGTSSNIPTASLTYNWTVGGNVSGSNISFAANTLPIGRANTVSVTATNNTTGCSVTASTTVSCVRIINANEVVLSTTTQNVPVTIDNNNLPVFSGCQGSSLTLNTLNEFGYRYEWSGITGISSNNTANATFTSTTSRVGVTLRAIPSGCPTVSTSAGLSGIVRPTVVAGPDYTICYGESFELFGINSNPANLPFEWFYVEGTNQRLPLGLQPVRLTDRTIVGVNSELYPDTNNRTVRYILEVNSNGCTATDEQVVTLDVKRGPIAFATADRPMICEGTTVTLRGNNIGATLNEINAANPGKPSARTIFYRWNGPSTLANPSGLLASGEITNPNARYVSTSRMNNMVPDLVVNPLTTTTYTLTITTPNSECVATCPVTVTVGPRLVATIMNVEGNMNLCTGPVTLRAISNSAIAGVRYQWVTDVLGTGLWTDVPGATNQEFMPTTGGRYNVRVSAGDMAACYDYADNWQTLEGVRGETFARDLVTVSVNREMRVVTKSITLCRGQEVDLVARYIFGASYQWYRVEQRRPFDPQPVYTMIPGADNHVFRTGTPGNYIVEVTAGCFDCPGACQTYSQVCPVVFVPAIRPTIHHNGSIELCNDGRADSRQYVELMTQGDVDGYSYEWFRDANNTGIFANATLIAGETRPRLLTNLTGDYWVRMTTRFCPVTGENCSGVSTNFVPVRACSTGICPAPTSVRGLASKTMCNTATIRWDQPLNTSQYNLTGNYEVRIRRNEAGAPFDVTATVTNNRLEFTTDMLVNNTSYVAEVRTLCTGANSTSTWVASMPFTTCATATCNAPTNLVATVTGSNLTASWTGNASATAYEVQVLPNTTGTPIAQTITAPTTTAAFNGLPDGTHTVRVRSICGGLGSQSAFTSTNFTVGTVSAACNAVVNVTTNNITTTSLTLNWENPVDPTGSRTAIIVEFAPFGSTTFTPITLGANEVTTTISGLTANTLYDIRITTRCGTVNSDIITLSERTNPVTTGGGLNPACLPASFTVSNRTSTSVSLLWTSVPGATDYTVRWRVRGAATFSPTNDGVNTVTNSFTIPATLTPNTEYEFSVRANGLPTCNVFLGGLFAFTLPTVAGAINPPVLQLASRGRTAEGLQFFDLVWNEELTAVNGYELEFFNLATPGNLFQVTIPSQTETTYRIQAMLTDSSQWIARIRSINNAFTPNFSGWSEIVLVTERVSPRVAGANASAAAQFSIYPNPNNGNFTVSYTAAQAGELTMNVLDVTGRVVMTTKQVAAEGDNTFPIAIDNAPVGIYMLQISGNGVNQTAKIKVE